MGVKSLQNVYISDRKREILTLLVSGFTNKRIAKMLGISPNTVRNHLVEISDATGIRGRTALATAAQRNGWIEQVGKHASKSLNAEPTVSN